MRRFLILFPVYFICYSLTFFTQVYAQPKMGKILEILSGNRFVTGASNAVQVGRAQFGKLNTFSDMPLLKNVHFPLHNKLHHFRKLFSPIDTNIS